MPVVFIVCCSMLMMCGCDEKKAKPLKTKGGVFLTVDFQQGQALKYKIISDRKVTTDWKPGDTRKSSKQKNDGYLEMVVAYEPVSVDEYGLSKIKVTFESVKVKITGGKRPRTKGAAETLKGKSFTMTVGPDGKIHDRSELRPLMVKTSKAAYRGTTKDPDLLDDVIVTQWYLWDAVSSIEDPIKGLKVKQSWQSQLAIPSTMLLRQGRDVTYSLDEVRQGEDGQIAVIGSKYSLSKNKSKVPLPYEGSFRLSGTFGFFMSMLKGLKVTELDGTGEQLYDIDSGLIIKDEQNYTATVKANAKPFPDTDPVITIEQKLSMTRIVE